MLSSCLYSMWLHIWYLVILVQCSCMYGLLMCLVDVVTYMISRYPRLLGLHMWSLDVPIHSGYMYDLLLLFVRCSCLYALWMCLFDVVTYMISCYPRLIRLHICSLDVSIWCGYIYDILLFSFDAVAYMISWCAWLIWLHIWSLVILVQCSCIYALWMCLFNVVAYMLFS